MKLSESLDVAFWLLIVVWVILLQIQEAPIWVLLLQALFYALISFAISREARGKGWS